MFLTKKNREIDLSCNVVINCFVFFFTFRDMINWDNTTEPPPTKNIPIEDLKKIGSGEKKLTDFIPKIMCHSIANERAVQNTHKQAQVRKSYKEKKVGILRANRSIKKVPYKFKLSHFIKDILKKPIITFTNQE